MPGTFFFVHGTGVRDEGFRRSKDAIAKGLADVGLSDVAIEGMSWGVAHGVHLERLEDVLPLENAPKAAEFEPSARDIEIAAWAQLLIDPLFELRLVAGAQQVIATSPIPAVQLPEQQARSLVRDVPSRLNALVEFGLAPAELKTAVDLVAASEELVGAARSFSSATDPELVAAMARAIVATALAAHRVDAPGTAPIVIYNAALRDQLVIEIAQVMSPAQPKGVRGWLRNKCMDFAKARAARYATQRRASLTIDSLPAIGDILFYQRRGEIILDRLATELAQLPRPLVAVGHSLGGIMLVDLLSRPNAPKVDLLVTVGSQSPLFFIIDSLRELRPSRTYQPFTPWLNIFDRSDLLSFCAQRAFPDQNHIFDREVSSGVSFPESHSAYWHLPAVYTLFREFWP